jgi:hypothetical protein
MRARLVSEEPLDLDKHRGMAAQKATEMRRADKAETNSLPENSPIKIERQPESHTA